MLLITTTDEWKNAHPGATFGLLELSAVDNLHPSAELQEQKRATEAGLRERYQGFTRKDFLALPVMSAYERYYKRLDKTYHVLLQLSRSFSRVKTCRMSPSWSMPISAQKSRR